MKGANEDGLLGCWAGDDVPPKANGDAAPVMVPPNDGGAAMAEEVAPNANGLAGDGFVDEAPALLPKKLVLVDEAVEPNADGAAFPAGVPNGEETAAPPNEGVLEPNADGVVDPKDRVVEGAAAVAEPNDGVVDAPKTEAVVVGPPKGPEAVPKVGAVVLAPNEGGAPKEVAPNEGVAGAVVEAAPNDGVFADPDPNAVDPNDETFAAGLAPNDGVGVPKVEDDDVVVVAPKVEPNA